MNLWLRIVESEVRVKVALSRAFVATHLSVRILMMEILLALDSKKKKKPSQQHRRQYYTSIVESEVRVKV